MRTAFVLLLFAFPLLAAPVPKAKAPPLEDKLRGKWHLIAQRGKAIPNSPFNIIFLSDGELEFRVEGRNQLIVNKGTYKVGEPSDENKLGTYDWKISEGGEEQSGQSMITELSEEVLEFKDPHGLVSRYERVKDK